MNDSEEQKEALLKWASHLLDREISDFKSLRDGLVFEGVMKRSNSFGDIKTNIMEGWKGNFVRLK